MKNTQEVSKPQKFKDSCPGELQGQRTVLSFSLSTQWEHQAFESCWSTENYSTSPSCISQVTKNHLPSSPVTTPRSEWSASTLVFPQALILAVCDFAECNIFQEHIDHVRAENPYTQFDILRPTEALNWLKLTKPKALTTPDLPNGIVNVSDNYAKNTDTWI